MNTVQYEKLFMVARFWLSGLAAADPRYYVAVKALDYFADLHKNETRSNGAKGFYHQLSILNFVRTQHASLTNPCDVYIAILGHDGYEDYQERVLEIERAFPAHFQYFQRLSKIRAGVKISNEEYFDDIASCAVCSVAKAGDRVHNFSTMSGAFSIDKQERYAEEGRTYFIPMLKQARRTFHAQEPVYEMFKSVLMMQIHSTDRLIEAVRKERKKAEPAIKAVKPVQARGRKKTVKPAAKTTTGKASAEAGPT